MRCLFLCLLFAFVFLRPIHPTRAISQPPPPTLHPLHIPLGLPTAIPIPQNNPLTPEKIDLGRRLFFDRRLSPNDTMSCAMCHIPAQGFTANEARLAVGISGKTGKRNAPALYNVAYQRLLFHDGREFTLEDQIISPMTNPVEMGNPSIGYVVSKIKQLSDYTQRFQGIFSEEPSVATLGKALASYQRTLLSGNAPFDSWYFGGEEHAVNDEVKAGFQIFSGKGKCFVCHSVGKDAALFTDHQFHNTGVAHFKLIPEKTVAIYLGGGLQVQMPRTQIDEILQMPGNDLGRYEVTLDSTDVWRYKTPSLRNVSLTAPYMHNGILLSLEEVIAYYDRGGTDIEGQDERISPLNLTASEKQALLTFLHSLTGDNVDELAQESYPHAALPVR